MSGTGQGGATVDQIEEIIQAASAVAEAAPLRQGSCVHAALIPWARIHRLRAALALAGVDL